MVTLIAPTFLPVKLFQMLFCFCIRCILMFDSWKHQESETKNEHAQKWNANNRETIFLGNFEFKFIFSANPAQ